MDEKLRLAETVLRQGELRLNAQLTVALAGDSKAITLAGLFVTLALAALSGVAVLWTIGDQKALTFGLIIEMILLLASAYLSLESASPADFYVSGNQPENWWSDNVEDKPLAECLKKESMNYQNRIEKNALVMERSAVLFTCAMRMAILSPIAALAVYFSPVLFSLVAEAVAS